MGKNKKIMVTGSLGYIGSLLVPYLTENNFDCIGYDAGFFRDCILYPPKKQKTILKDVRHITKDDLKGIDVVIHLAGISNDPFGNLSAEKVYDTTRVYSLRLAKMCKEMGIKFIFASSCSVYGRGSDQLLTEESETHPQTPYSLNKLQIEQDLKEITDKNFSPIILRFATIFGLSPRMRFDIVINMFIGMAFTTKKIVLNSDGKAWRPHVHIKDVCKAIKYSIDYEYNSDKAFILNVGATSLNYQIWEIKKLIEDQIPDCEITYLQNSRSDTLSNGQDLIKDRKIQDGVDTRTYKVSFELIKKKLNGFQCDWSVEKRIEKMIDDFRKLELTEEQFKNINFYRLQKMEYLFKSRHLSDDLFWNKN